MLKGFNRRVVVMKNTGSDLFDEAYFIVRENAPIGKKRGEVSAVDEAENIIFSLSGKKRERSTFSFFRDRRFIFACGVVLGVIFGKIIFI